MTKNQMTDEQEAMKIINLANDFDNLCKGKEMLVVMPALSSFLLELYKNNAKEDVSLEKFLKHLTGGIFLLASGTGQKIR